MVTLEDISGDDLIAGWQMCVTMQMRTPLHWLQRHGEFREGAYHPTEELPPEHAVWVPVPKTWRALCINEDEIPETTMASEVGQIPVDGGDFLPFLLEYRMMIVEGLQARCPIWERGIRNTPASSPSLRLDGAPVRFRVDSIIAHRHQRTVCHLQQ